MGERSNDKIAVLLMAHGAPNALEEIAPFLGHIMKDRKPSAEVVAQIRERYRLIGGKSPLLEISMQQAMALEHLLNGEQRALGPRIRVYVGMRHWDPFIHEAVKTLIDDGADRLIAVCLAPQYSRLSVGAYIETLKKTLSEGGGALPVKVVERWHDEPYLLDAFAEKVENGLSRYTDEDRPFVRLLFTAHSLPNRVLEDGDPYPSQVAETVAGVVNRLGQSCGPIRWRFAYQSRGLRPGKWLGPEVEEIIDEMAASGDRHLLLVPVGFVSDHVEVLYDVDILYKEIAASKGIKLQRTESLNISPLFISALAAVVRPHL